MSPKQWLGYELRQHTRRYGEWCSMLQ